MNRRENEYTFHNTAHYHSSGQTLTTDSKASARRQAFSSGAELSYELDTLNLVTASIDIYRSSGRTDSRREDQITAANGSLMQKYTQTSFYPKYHYLDIDANVNYQRSTRLKGENITLSYRISTTDQKLDQQTDFTDTYNFPAAYTGIRSNFDLRFFEHTFQLDWTRPIASKHTLDVGAKYIARRNHSKNLRDYIGSNQTYDNFCHNTDIAAAFADFRSKFGKFGVRGGFRYEYSRLGAKFIEGEGNDFSSSINDYVPNATVSYTPDDANSFKLTFNRRISRPGISYLNPTVSAGPLSTNSGNPHLKSTIHNSVSINYSLIRSKFNIDFSATYSFSNNALTETMEVIGDHIYYTYANAARYRQLSGFLYARWSPNEKTRFSTNLYCAVIRQSVPDGSSLCRPVYNPYINFQQTLPHRFKLIVNVGWWSGNVQNAYSYMKPSMGNFWNNIRLQRFFLNDDRLSTTLVVSNPFGSYDRKSTTITETSDYHSEEVSRQPHNFSIGLSINYRFGSLKASVKKTAASIENSDLTGRKN